MVYVISKSGKPLMPTQRHGMVRVLLKEKRAKVVEVKPFTIKLLYETTEYVEPVKLGIDSGYKYIGYSAITSTKELASGEVELLEGQKKRIKKKSDYRKLRRGRLRHRKSRFDNRRIDRGWLAPSIKHKLDTHHRFIDNLSKMLPISSITVEIASFDTHKLKNPDVSGKDYQDGEQKGFYNLREYIFHRDNHECQLCKEEKDNKGKKIPNKNLSLQVHHIGFYKGDMSNRPGNLMTLCIKCHVPKGHKKDGKLWGLKGINKSFKAATFMTLIRKRLVIKLNCQYTYGYITKSERIHQGLDKSHYNDAFVIAGGVNQKRANVVNYKQVRRNNRSLEKFYDAKFIDIRTGEKASGGDLSSGRRVRNKNLNEENLRLCRGVKLKKGKRTIRTKRYFYQPNDLVRYNGGIYTVRGTQNKGTYVALRETKKVAKVELLKPYLFRQGLCVI